MNDTIVAIATPKGVGGVGVVRISGPLVTKIAKRVCQDVPEPRRAVLRDFRAKNNEIIDSGIVLFFPGPHSFTGEDVLELQGHGGPCVLNRVVKTIIEMGARLASPGEFSQRAFLNDKIDLTQAEAIADLIHAKTEQAARAATNALKGEFSERINDFADKLLRLRVFVESALDFPDEDIEFVQDGKILEQLCQLITDLEAVFRCAQQGQILRDGITVALVGEPNVGKSSIFNLLLQEDRAIVCNEAGTTRDVLREEIQVQGFPITLLDTAGIRENAGLIEQEGILRTLNACQQVDHILLVVDASVPELTPKAQQLINEYKGKISIVANKVDKAPALPRLDNAIMMSAKDKHGVADLLGILADLTGSQGDETLLIARERHLVALNKALDALKLARGNLANGQLELAAHELQAAHDFLAEITGKVTSDMLLGEIFSSFCIGK